MLYKSADGINEYLFGITISFNDKWDVAKHQIEQVYLRRQEDLAEFPLCGETWPDL